MFISSQFLSFVALVLLATDPAWALSRPPSHLRPLQATPDFDVYAFTPADASGLQWYETSGTVPSTGRHYVGHVATFAASSFSFRPPTASGCHAYIKTSVSSNSTWSCDYATNGGFFNWDETADSHCEGNLIYDGDTIVLDGMDRANLGVTKDNNVVIGFINKDTATALDFKHLMSGYGWLVRNGTSYVTESSDLSLESNFVVEKAPRTSVGVFANGTMILFQVDGEESIYYGPDLFEIAELLVDLGVTSAVNIDGGGSSVSVFRGGVVSVPTCNDTPRVCEREVQSITCVSA
jgi:N-acetylglucosamine-1-phosphodiester alpha-N-acetylglucosaminidase